MRLGSNLVDGMALGCKKQWSLYSFAGAFFTFTRKSLVDGRALYREGFLRNPEPSS